MDTDTIFVFVALGILVLGFGAMAEASYEENLTRVTVSNETSNISSFDTALNLDGSNIDGARYDDNITARNSSDTLLVNGTDYKWYRDNGTIEYFDTVNTSLGESISVTYGYDDPTETQFAFLQLTAGLNVVGPVVLLILGVLVLLSVRDQLPT